MPRLLSNHNTVQAGLSPATLLPPNNNRVTVLITGPDTGTLFCAFGRDPSSTDADFALHANTQPLTLRRSDFG